MEGWALYGESLGEELGLYKDPYSKFGQLTYEMWRAVRLVVDTGMHSMGWTREQAIQFFKDNTGKTDQDITVEVDRYIVWPGQALAYKLGQLQIRKLRNEAEKRLGAKFDVRRFHDAVLENGAVPLNVLEAQTKSGRASGSRPARRTVFAARIWVRKAHRGKAAAGGAWLFLLRYDRTLRSGWGGHRAQEFGVGLGLGEAAEQQLHRFDGRERAQNLAQDPDAA